MASIVESLKGLRAILSGASAASTSVAEGITQVREAIKEKRHALKRAKLAPLPLDEIAPRIRQHVEHAGSYWLGEYGSSLINGERGLAVPDLKGAPRIPWTANAAMPWAALCAAQPDVAADILMALAQRVPYAAGPPSSARPGIVARLEAELHELEHAEESAIDEAAAAGVVIEHRPEVIQRRVQDAHNRELRERSVVDRRAREAALDERHARVGHSAYITEGQAKRR